MPPSGKSARFTILFGLIPPSKGFEMGSDVEHSHWRRFRQSRLTVSHWKRLHALTKTGIRMIIRVRPLKLCAS